MTDVELLCFHGILSASIALEVITVQSIRFLSLFLSLSSEVMRSVYCFKCPPSLSEGSLTMRLDLSSFISSN